MGVRRGSGCNGARTERREQAAVLPDRPTPASRPSSACNRPGSGRPVAASAALSEARHAAEPCPARQRPRLRPCRAAVPQVEDVLLAHIGLVASLERTARPAGLGSNAPDAAAHGDQLDAILGVK